MQGSFNERDGNLLLVLGRDYVDRLLAPKSYEPWQVVNIENERFVAIHDLIIRALYHLLEADQEHVKSIAKAFQFVRLVYQNQANFNDLLLS